MGGTLSVTHKRTDGQRTEMLVSHIGCLISVSLLRMIIHQLESEGAQVTLLDPLQIQAPLLAQPLHWMKVNIAQQTAVLNIIKIKKNLKSVRILSLIPLHSATALYHCTVAVIWKTEGSTLLGIIHIFGMYHFTLP